MPKFRKKPVVIEAMPVCDIIRDQRKPHAVFPTWLHYALANDLVKIRQASPIAENPNPYLVVYTLEGEMRAEQEDMLIQGVKGELYPCKPDIFAATYEAVE